MKGVGYEHFCAIVGSNQQKGKGGPVARRIDGYTPQSIPAADWEAIGPLVRDIAWLMFYRNPESVNSLLYPVSRFVWWCWKRGLPLEPGSLFTQQHAEEFFASGCEGAGESSWATIRSAVRRVTAVYDPLSVTTKAPRKYKVPVYRPYSEQELRILRQWAKREYSATRSRNAQVLLALGDGVGLANREIVALHVDDLEISDNGVLVRPDGPDGRAVPVMREWEQVIVDAVSNLDGTDYVFQPGRTSAHANAVTTFVGRCNSPGISLTTSRLRATWLVRHLSRGVPVDVLARATGLSGGTGLMRYLAFVPERDDETAIAWLRDGDGIS